MIDLKSVSKRYARPGGDVVGLNSVTLSLVRGDFACLRGPSGSGKTTLLLTVGGMQRPTSGRVDVAGQDDLYALSASQRAQVRARHIGYVFQLFHLVPYLNVAENIRLGAVASDATSNEIDAMIDRLRLAGRREHSPQELSVGECQRVAVARALISKPEVILADEPTGNLDAENAQIVIDVFREFCDGGGVLIFATHSDQPASQANRWLTIDAGTVSEGSRDESSS